MKTAKEIISLAISQYPIQLGVYSESDIVSKMMVLINQQQQQA
jgi:hypothetical protein